MTTLLFRLEGEHRDLEWLRSRIDGAISDAIDEAEEDNRLDGAVAQSWEWED